MPGNKAKLTLSVVTVVLSVAVLILAVTNMLLTGHWFRFEAYPHDYMRGLTIGLLGIIIGLLFARFYYTRRKG